MSIFTLLSLFRAVRDGDRFREEDKIGNFHTPALERTISKLVENWKDHSPVFSYRMIFTSVYFDGCWTRTIKYQEGKGASNGCVI